MSFHQLNGKRKGSNRRSGMNCGFFGTTLKVRGGDPGGRKNARGKQKSEALQLRLRLIHLLRATRGGGGLREREGPIKCRPNVKVRARGGTPLNG